MSLNLDSSVSKLQWANTQAERIKDEIESWINSNPYQAIPTVSVDCTKYSVVHKVVTPPSLERWSLLCGDFFHNLRSALDHMVYSIAVHITGSNPPPTERRWAFPITENPTGKDGFTDKRNRIDGKNRLGDRVWAILEGVQPYHRPHQQLPPILLLLETLDNTDKHRLLQWAVEDIYGWQINNIRREDGGSIPIPTIIHNPYLKDGAEVAALVFPVPTPNVKYSFDAVVSLSIFHPVGPNGRNRTDIGNIITDFLEETTSVIETVKAEFVKAGIA